MDPSDFPDYSVAARAWRRSKSIDIRSANGSRIARIPLDFILKGGHPEWSYVVKVLEEITERTSDSKWTLGDENGQPVVAQDTPKAGKYVYKSEDDDSPEPTYSRGPENFVAGRAFIPGAYYSKTSEAKYFDETHPEFWLQVMARDGTCWLTDSPHESCTATHMVPLSRPDVYEQVLGYPMPDLFEPAFAIVVRDDMHHAFQCLNWSLYHKDGAFYVHCFNRLSSKEGTAHPHGKKITVEKFRSPIDDYPDPRLANWHYKQCLMTYFRGFPVGVESPRGSFRDEPSVLEEYSVVDDRIEAWQAEARVASARDEDIQE